MAEIYKTKVPGFKINGRSCSGKNADLEHNSMNLKTLLIPLVNNDVAVVSGFRFLSKGSHRVLHFWHHWGNRFLAFLSNMSPELTRFRIFEMYTSSHGHTYAEGKKIGAKGGYKTLYSVFRHYALKAPLIIQFLLYSMIGGLAALANFFVFLVLFYTGIGVNIAAPTAFVTAAIVNYLLCISILFRHKARWSSRAEPVVYTIVVILVGILDLLTTKSLMSSGVPPGISKVCAIGLAFILNFCGRRFLVFPELSSEPQRSQEYGDEAR
jgi:putative flippase GtrA